MVPQKGRMKARSWESPKGEQWERHSVIGWVVLWERVREVLLVGWRDGGLGFEKDPKRERWKEEMLGQQREEMLVGLTDGKRGVMLATKLDLLMGSLMVNRWVVEMGGMKGGKLVGKRVSLKDQAKVIE
jgi:hypothetical protein